MLLTKKKRSLRSYMAIMLMVLWLFSGWPQMPYTNFPPRIEQVFAALPTYKGAGTFTAGVGAITPPYPTGGAAPAANDVCLLVVTSENQAISLTTAQGFAEIAAYSPQSAGTAATNPGSRLAVYWKRTAGGDTAPTVADSGDNTEGRIYCFSGVVTSGNPWNIGAGGNDSAANDTTGVIPGATTTVNDALIVMITSTSFNGTSTAQCSGWTNASLANVTEQGDATNTAGLGGGHCLATGQLATAGTYNATTVTLANTSYKGAISLALQPVGTPDDQQIHYRWRNDDGTEGANSETPTWYGANWGYRKKITIDHTKVSGTSNLTNFPVEISFTDTDLKDVSNSGHVQQNDAGDILFTNSSGTQLNHEIEKYAPSTGELVAWVQVDSLSYTADTDIYMYYGNSTDTGNQWNINGVWDSNYKMVQHLEEGTTGATDFKDSTSNANDSNGVTIDGAGSNAAETGKIDGAVHFDGANDNILVPDSASLDITSSFTIEAWYNADTLPSNLKTRSIVAKTGDVTSAAAADDANYSLTMDQNLSGTGQFLSVIFEDSAHAQHTATVNFTSTTGTWYHLVGVFDDTANTLTLYRNGTQVAQTTGITQTPSTNNRDLYIGVDNAANFSAFSEYFDGIVDEVRVEDTVRSADWVTTEYNNQNSPGTGGFLTSVGSEIPRPTGASFAANEDTQLTNAVKSTIYRLRLEISNEGTATDGGATHQLQVAETSTCSSGTYAAVPTDTSGHWQVTNSTYLTDGSATTNFTGSLTDESTTFVAGEQKDTGNTTGTITLASNRFTEIEFAVTPTNNATDGGTYCFRLTNTTTYTIYASAVLQAGTPTYTLSSYRWYVDSDSENVTDPWGNPDIAESTALAVLPVTNNAIQSADEIRLRVGVTVGTSNLSATSAQFKLQYKAGTDGSCTTGSWTDVGAGGGAEIWRFASSSVTDGTTLTVLHLSGGDVKEVYAKSNPTTSNPNAATVGQEMEYDFHIQNNGASDNTTYSFKVTKSDGTVLGTYTYCPTLTTKPGTSDVMRHGNFFTGGVEQGFLWAN